jgi:uncharacterized protein (DUF2062 family)
VPRNLIKRWLPDRAKLRNHPNLQVFGARLHDPNLWHLNRRSVAGGLALGVFVAFIPLPLQMLMAAALSLWLRVNLPLAVATVWITNPITIPPIFYIGYKVGSWMLSSWPLNLILKLSPNDHLMWQSLGTYAGPLLLGLLCLGTILSLLTYAAIRFAWWLNIINRIRRRRQRDL